MAITVQTTAFLLWVNIFWNILLLPEYILELFYPLWSLYISKNQTPCWCFPDHTRSSTLSGLALAWQQLTAMLIKRFHHTRRDWKSLLAQLLLPVLFVVVAMGLGSIKSDVHHYPELELSPALYNVGPSYSFFRSDPFSREITGHTRNGNQRSKSG